jgi:hypothetical protein
MAVIEIAKIQVRRGQENQTGVPQLAGGEFAWAADTEKLYIGLRRDDGGSRDQNIEILTENHLRNLFNLGLAELNYTYREHSTSTVVAAGGITAEDGTNDEISRPIQDKLDDFVSCKDFGVVGDGNIWDIRRLQLAIDRLYLNTGGYNPRPAKKLYFPAGTYVIPETVHIPARTSIIGDGPGKTIFVFTPGPTTTDTVMFQTCDLSSAGGSTGYKTFDTGAGSGAEFSSTGTAREVHIEDVTMQYDPVATTVTDALSLLNLDCADNSVIKNVEFVGNLNSDTVGITSSSYVGLTIRGKTKNGTNEHAIVDNCVFNNLYHGVVSNDDIKGTVISNSEFSDLIRGITFNDPISGTAQVGPRLVKIEKNKFFNIDREAIYVGPNNSSTGSFVTSQDNYFNQVGDYFLTDPDQENGTSTTIISFISGENASFNDYFDRYYDQNRLNNTAEAETTTFTPLVEGRTSLDMLHVTTATIAGGESLSFLRIPITTQPQHLTIKYHAFKSQESGTTSTVMTSAVAAGSSTIVVAYVENIWPGSICTGIGIEPGSVVSTVGRPLRAPETLSIRLDRPVNGVAAGAALDFTINRTLDKMGDLRLYLQQGNSPEYILVDDYNYITEWGDYSGGISFTTNINSSSNYYELIATVNPDVIGNVTLEFQTKLMI